MPPSTPSAAPDDPLLAAALALWPGLARQAGLAAPERVEFLRLLTRREDPRQARLLLALRHGGPDGARDYVLKHVTRPHGNGVFEAQAAMQAQAQAAMAQQAAMQAQAGPCAAQAVPRVLALAPGDQALLQPLVPAEAAETLLEAATSLDRMRAILGAAGRWLAAFHRAGGPQSRPYRPHKVMAHLESQATAVARGQRAVAEPRLFLRLQARLRADLDALAQGAALGSWKHGDAHLGNILLSGDLARGWGVDFGIAARAPVGHDLARLLIGHACRFAQAGRQPPGAVLVPEDAAAFFAGYDLVGPEDAGLRFLLRVQILAEWARLPGAAAGRDLAQDLRLQGLMRLAGRAFPGLLDAG